MAYAAQRDKTERDQFQEVMLHGETLVFIAIAIVATVVEYSSTFRETCLATEVVSQRRCTQFSAKSFNV